MRFALLAATALILMPAAALAQEPTPAPPAEVAVIPGLVAQVSADRIEADIRTLVGFGTRHSLSETESDTRGIGAARRWVHAEFERISAACGGCLEVMYIGREYTGERVPEPTEIISVVAIQRGTADPNRHVLIGGHLDSRVTDVMNFTDDAPGANDDASGVAGAIEAARVLSTQRFPGSIVYVAFSGEEQGLVGARFVAEHAREQNWRLIGVLNNDMIGNIRGITGAIDNGTARIFSEGPRVTESETEARQRRFTGGEIDSPSRNLARYIDGVADRYIANLDTQLVYRLDRFGRGGDHRSFNDLGFPAVRVMETLENYDRQHQDLRTENGVAYGDVIEGVDFDYAAKLTSLNVAALAALSLAPPPPADVTIGGAVSADTTLKWTLPSAQQAPNLAGYRIYWRETTAPQWTHSRWVGRVAEHTLENTIIDNYAFGIAAVSTDGAESPVVFPGAAGSFGGY
ncbi:M20/M25/M40 family metallo-hydrolase [Brevundimonas sp.]|uniref:M20/M25/M40 family metallo-hydrolase n=1 Tax=Brevundimonas sp. TaxID=1871086 RepID=UPI0035AEF5AD